MHIRRLMRRTGALARSLSFVSSCLLASTSGATATEHAHAKGLDIRPCTTGENELSSSPEIARKFDEQSTDNRPPFQWCEAVDVDWLPSATMLRFHTAIHVDYAYTYTLLRAKSGEGLHVMQFGEGLVGGNTSPKLSDAIKAFNDLLDYSAQGSVGKARSEAACVLFLFLVGRENRTSFFMRPEGEHPVRISDYKPAFRTVAGQPTVTIRTRSAVWQFTFSAKKGKLNLASASEDSASKATF